nr:EOG090X0NBY [Leptodora kindtii]
MASSRVRLLFSLKNKAIGNLSAFHKCTFSTASRCMADAVTHTGQAWQDDDSRLVRFDNTPKQINSSFAIDLIAQVPPKEVESRHVYCDGGGGALGHPKVYINLDKPGNHTCGYCGLRFKMAHHH